MSQLPMKIRPATTNDINFILSSWIQSYRLEIDKMNYDMYNMMQNKLSRDILNRAITIVAVSEEDIDQIFGYLVFEFYKAIPVIHYLYVKAIYREMGIAKKLTENVTKDATFYYSHKTRKIPKNGLYVPYLAYKEMING